MAIGSGVYCCSLHPTLDVLCTGGRDSSGLHVSTMFRKNHDTRQCECGTSEQRIKFSASLVTRTQSQVSLHRSEPHLVVGLLNFLQGVDPQIISGSHDSTVKLWDLAAGKAYATLTHHKKGVRALALHPNKYLFASGSADNLKQVKIMRALLSSSS